MSRHIIDRNTETTAPNEMERAAALGQRSDETVSAEVEALRRQPRTADSGRMKHYTRIAREGES